MHGQKVIVGFVGFSEIGQVGQLIKFFLNHFFLKQKFEIGLLDFFVYGKL